MFKPLLRTLPTLSGNFTIACKLREFNKENNNEYYTYVRLANMIPLQNFMANKDLELNLLNGKYEYDISKYHYYYSNVFYKNNYNYNKNNYAILDLNSIYNYNNDSRNKDYEFGCKRIQYSQNGSQFNFYAPIYIDNVNDLPEYFCINIVINDHLTKKIKIYINKDNKRNYLKNYLTRYLKQIDERVIFCLPDSMQATYFGIDVKNGGIEQYKDNIFGDLYVSQKTINNFDYTICKGFERNNMIMRQIIPLSFSFNINDLFNKYERNFFNGQKFQVYGHYYTEGNTAYDMYDFDINYTNSYTKFNKYNEYTGLYDFAIGKDDNNKSINIMDVGFPALNESKYTKYVYTNKITPMYCKFKMMLSSDNNPYITNINFAYSFNQYPNQKYGEFPTMFKGLFPKVIIDNNDLKLPIGASLDKYYKVIKNIGNKLVTNTNNIDKYNKLMSNYCSSWYTMEEYIPDFNDPKFIKNFFENHNWADVKYGYSYFNGILYNLKEIGDIDKFAVFCGAHLNYLTEENFYNALVKADMLISSETLSTGKKFYNYNQSYDMKIYDKDHDIEYYNKIIDISLNNFNGDNIKINQNMIKDLYGTYIIEENYIEENMFYKVSDILTQFKQYLTITELKDKIIEKQVNGFELLEAYNNINFFEEKLDNIYGKEKVKQFMLIDKVYGTQEYLDRYHWLYDSLYYTTQLTYEKYKVSDNYESIYYNEDVNGKMCMFIKDTFIHKNDLVNIIKEYEEDLAKFGDLNLLLRTYFNYLGTNDPSAKLIHTISDIDRNILDIDGKIIRKKLDDWLLEKLGSSVFNNLKLHYAYNQFRQILLNMITRFNKDSNIDISDIKQTEFIKGHNLVFLINYLPTMTSYKYEVLGNKNGIDIKNYFIKNETNEKNIYVDPYNLNYYVGLYNKEYINDKINVNNLTHKKFFSSIINKDHLIEYCQKLKNSDNEYNDLLTKVNLLDLIYVKERCWYIENNKMNIKDRYISLYNYLYKKFIELGDDERRKLQENEKKDKKIINRYLTILKNYLEYFVYLHNSDDNGLVLQWIINSLSDTKSVSNKFTFNVQLVDVNIAVNWNIELELCIYKDMVLFDENLKKLIKNNYFLYLFIPDKMTSENLSMWPIISTDNIVNRGNYIYKNTDDYLIPLFTNIYFNENDFNTIKQMISNNKINENNKYIVLSNKYFKEIDVDDTFRSLLINNDKNIYDIIDDINKLNKIHKSINNDFDEIKGLIANHFNFNYNVFNDNIEELYQEKILLEHYFEYRDKITEEHEHRDQITEEQFRNDYKDTFEMLLEHTITSLESLNNTENDIVRLRYIYNVLDIQYNIYIYLNNLNMYDILNDIDNWIANNLQSGMINNIRLLNTDKLENTIIKCSELKLRYLNECLSEFNNIKYLLKNLFDINKKFQISISNFSINNLDIKTLINNIDLFITYLNNNTFVINWINEIKNFEQFTDKMYEQIKYEWNEYCLSNDVYIEDVDKDTYIDRIDFILEYIKTYHNELYYQLIKNHGIILYSISKILDIKYDAITGNNIEYNSLYNIYTYTYNDKKYAFYYINIDVDNTNNSFNVLDEFNLNIQFDSIDNIKIIDDRFNSFFTKIFYLLEPFLKINIFNEFVKNINTIIYPYEAELNIEYMSSLLNDDSIKLRYKLMADGGNLYNNIVKMSKSKKIKLLRYFNYITPLLLKTNVIMDNWELQFINNDNSDIYTKKYNIFNKENINIYKYNGIKYYKGKYSKAKESFMLNGNIETPTILNQYEYKHFNDNVLYNLPEEIVIDDKKVYTYNDLVKYKENDNEILEEKKNILLKYFNDLGLDYNNIILFLFNKYDSNMTIEPIKLRANKNEKLYKVSYKFKLI